MIPLSLLWTYGSSGTSPSWLQITFCWKATGEWAISQLDLKSQGQTDLVVKTHMRSCVIFILNRIRLLAKMWRRLFSFFLILNSRQKAQTREPHCRTWTNSASGCLFSFLSFLSSRHWYFPHYPQLSFSFELQHANVSFFKSVFKAPHTEKLWLPFMLSL